MDDDKSSMAISSDSANICPHTIFSEHYRQLKVVSASDW